MGRNSAASMLKSVTMPRCAASRSGRRAPTPARRLAIATTVSEVSYVVSMRNASRRTVRRSRDDDGRIGPGAPGDPRPVGAEHAPQAAEDRIPQRLGVAAATMPVVTSRAASPNCARASCSRRWIIAVTASASGRAVRSSRSRRRPRNDSRSGRRAPARRRPRRPARAGRGRRRGVAAPAQFGRGAARRRRPPRRRPSDRHLRDHVARPDADRAAGRKRRADARVGDPLRQCRRLAVDDGEGGGHDLAADDVLLEAAHDIVRGDGGRQRGAGAVGGGAPRRPSRLRPRRPAPARPAAARRPARRPSGRPAAR